MTSVRIFKPSEFNMFMGFERFDITKKIRTISLDTNVLSDVPCYYMLKQKKRLSEKKKSYYERCCKSMNSIILILSVRVKPPGIKIVKKELKSKPAFLELYNAIFEKQISVNKEIKYLAKSYMSTGIKAPDALILASASVGNVDLFLSWNRRDIVNENNLERIRTINEGVSASPSSQHQKSSSGGFSLPTDILSASLGLQFLQDIV